MTRLKAALARVERAVDRIEAAVAQRPAPAAAAAPNPGDRPAAAPQPEPMPLPESDRCP